MRVSNAAENGFDGVRRLRVGAGWPAAFIWLAAKRIVDVIATET